MGLPSFIIPIMKKSAYLPLTTAWIAATGETNATILSALNTFEAGLIANSLTGKFNALYPFVGGNSTKHSYNFMNTAQFQLTFVGGWTHSANGALPNGTNSHANTGLTPSSTLTLNDSHLSVYSRTNTNIGIDIGVAFGGNSSIAARNGGNFIGNINQSANTLVTNADSRGYFVASRTGSSVIDGYRNGSNIIAGTTVSTLFPTLAVYLGARNLGGTTDARTTRQLALASIGSGLTSGEVSTLYTLIQAFQTSLSRQV